MQEFLSDSSLVETLSAVRAEVMTSTGSAAEARAWTASRWLTGKVDSLAQTREPWIDWQSAGLLMFCRWTGPTLADLMSKGNHGLAGRKRCD